MNKLTSVIDKVEGQKSAVRPMTMQCPECREVSATVAQSPGKGGRIDKATVVQDQCKSGKTKIENVGVEMQATASVKHSCSENRTAGSFATEKNSSN